ncbi:MAG: thioesterase family protein [Planctomycetota bacterium]
MSDRPSHTTSLRVRYTEVDAMGYLHHSRFLQYFEIGRVEFLRHLGVAYADLEKRGIYFVVTRAEVQYKKPAQYDETVTLTTTAERQTRVKIEHSYAMTRGDDLLATGRTTIACIDTDGRPRPIPDELSGFGG